MLEPEGEAVHSFIVSAPVKVSLIIPHFSETRSENLNKLIDEIKAQSFQGIEIIIVRGVSPQGKAINEGVSRSQGEILMVMDDDSRMGNSSVIENLVRVIRENPSVGMAGASILTPPEANPFQKRAVKQFPRFNMPIVDEITDSDFPCHGCAAFPRGVFFSIGKEREDILRGLDPDLRVRIRNAGYRVVLVPDTWAYHPLPESLSKFIRVFIRNGYGSAYLQATHPEINYDTSERVSDKTFMAKRSFFYRIFRYPVRLIQSFLTFQWLRFLGYSVYLLGYLAGYVRFGVLKSLPANLNKK